ncbi:ras-domain-containing protein [Ramaria rubella]|nr:ras-domain-containing protein [Ramaria rubella]
MRTIKLVIIGDSGVGKTSLRSSYVSGRFSTGYRATIGTDFITKALPHYSNPEEVVVLQIWDTAGQERFSSLATAFFRGADAVLMMYDVNKPHTLQGLKKWWKEFQERAPVPDGEAPEYCCVVVGNKIDLAEGPELGRKMAVSEEDVEIFLKQLIPLPSISPVGSPAVLQARNTLPQIETQAASPPERPSTSSNGTVHLNDDEELAFHPKPIDIRFANRGHCHSPPVSRATSRSRLGTMTTTHTSLSIYHTPSSSFFEEFVSAPSSPIHSATSSNLVYSQTVSPGPSRRRDTVSTTSSSDTITPSLFARPASISTSLTPVPLDRGPKHFLTSAKSGQSVSAVFEYIAKRVLARWEWEESVHDRTLSFSERPSEIRTVRLHSSTKDLSWTNCCS